MKHLFTMVLMMLVVTSASANNRLYGAVASLALVVSDVQGALLQLEDSGSHIGFHSESIIGQGWLGELGIRMALDSTGRGEPAVKQATLALRADKVGQLGFFYGATPLGKTQAALHLGEFDHSPFEGLLGGFLGQRLVTADNQPYQPPNGTRDALGLGLTIVPVRERLTLNMAVMPAQQHSQESGASVAVVWQSPVIYLALAYELNGYGQQNSIGRALSEFSLAERAFGIFYQQAEDTVNQIQLNTFASYARWPMNLAHRLGEIQWLMARA